MDREEDSGESDEGVQLEVSSGHEEEEEEEEVEESSSSSIHESYRIDDSDSDEDEDLDMNEYAQSQDLQELKEQTKNLLDPQWKEDRNMHLLNKMLELEEPSISAKMVDFLLQPGVCENLTNFITQVGTRNRPHPHESNSMELKYSYRATMLISVDEPSDALLMFLGKKARVIASGMFDIFCDESAGSFYHAARVLESLLRAYPGEVYQGLLDDGQLEKRMKSILRYVGYPPVGDLVVILIALTPVPRSSPVYSGCFSCRSAFFEGLVSLKFLNILTQLIVNPTDHCRVDEYINAEQHSSAAAQVLSELVEKLSSDEISEKLLQDLSVEEVLKPLFDRSTGIVGCVKDELEKKVAADCPDLYFTSRQSSLRLLSFFLKKSLQPQNTCFIMGPQGQPVQTLIPNRLHPVRPSIVAYLASRVEDLQVTIVESKISPAASEHDEDRSVVHPGHVCRSPFSSYLVQLVELFTLLVEASCSSDSGAKDDDADSNDNSDKPQLLERVTAEVWKCLIAWVFEYPHNNIYHTMFYRILFAALRQNNEKSLRVLFRNCRLISCLVDAFQPLDSSENDDMENREVKVGDNKTGKVVILTYKDRIALRGLLINCCNAIRLQASSLPATSFLRTYMFSHSKWLEFVPTLRESTKMQHPVGLGHYVPASDTKVNGSYMDALMSLQQDETVDGIDHGSNYAKFLGFEDEIEWPDDNFETKKKKKKKGKKKKKNHRRRTKSSCSSDDDNDGSEQNSDDEYDDDADNSDKDDRRMSTGTDDSTSSGEGDVDSESVDEPSEGRSSNENGEEAIATTDLDKQD